MKFIRIICVTLLLAALTSLLACSEITRPSLPREMVYFDYFDTVTYIYDYSGASEESFAQRCDMTKEILGKYHKLLDIYNEYSGMNNLCTVNKNAGGEAVSVAPELIDFLLYAKGLYEKTNGEMNIMMGAVLRLWHDARDNVQSGAADARIPSKAEREEAAKHTDIGSLEIDTENKTVRIADPKARLDIGAVGKGYAAERAAEILRADGADGYVLDLGGNLKIIGTKPDGSGWKTGIRNPHDTQNYSHYLTLSDTSCVTSGDYERYFTFNGEKYHHIIDKDTLMPSEHFSSVTVITHDSGIADALSTALFCMSYEDGLELLKKFPEVEVIWITKDGQKHLTDGIK